jgi:glycosyltransferase involved in cell wall biosynthesis
MTERLSAVIITYNAERELPACLASVTFADEVVIVDSGSTDRTLVIAERSDARIIKQEWLGYGAQKRFAANQARNRWVLCLDADERVSAPLRTSLQAVLGSPAHAAYAVPRCNRFMGRWLRHGEGYPDWTVRLFDREHAQWTEDTIHEKVVVRGSTGRVYGDLLHESEAGLANYLEKQNRYTTLQAAALRARGKRASVARLIMSPLLRFVKFYFLRLGFLDGIPGLVHISIGCWNSFTKYAKLRALELE